MNSFFSNALFFLLWCSRSFAADTTAARLFERMLATSSAAKENGQSNAKAPAVNRDLQQPLLIDCVMFMDSVIFPLFDQYGAGGETYSDFRQEFCLCTEVAPCDFTELDVQCLGECALSAGQFNIMVLLDMTSAAECTETCETFIGEDYAWSCEDACGCAFSICGSNYVSPLDFPFCVKDCYCLASNNELDGMYGLKCDAPDVSMEPSMQPSLMPSMM
ncbi:hypothetical protein ACA910_004414 [Epithemia clementina (nom. ined.)]